ncbi:MAG: AAA family ATPase [Clostridiales bacterium]|nr:AAA family ATPase [Clostridiales bacterium]
MSKFFKAVLVTGARQTGKTTMLRHLAEGTNRTYVSMDRHMERNLAKSDPDFDRLEQLLHPMQPYLTSIMKNYARGGTPPCPSRPLSPNRARPRVTQGDA